VFIPLFLVAFLLLDLLVDVYVLYIVVCPFVLSLLAIVLSVLHRFTDSDYPFGIFKLFLQMCPYDVCEWSDMITRGTFFQ